MLPGKGGQARLWSISNEAARTTNFGGMDGLHLLQSGVMGVLTGLTRTLSR